MFDTTTAQLLWDDDGAGGNAAALIATLTGVASLAATEITVIA